MGIKDINKTLKDIIEEVLSKANEGGANISSFGFRQCPLENFKGKKIAVDVSIVLISKIFTTHCELIDECTDLLNVYDYETLKNRYMKSILTFFSMFIKAGVTPVIVFDGTSHPMKIHEVEKRKKDRQQKQDNVDRQLDQYMLMQPHQRTKIVIDDLKKALKSNFKVNRTDFEEVWNVLSSLGFKCLRASYEAEKLCASLCLEGLVSAVFSTDTDNYALGTPIMISKISWNDNRIMCECVMLNEILFCLSMYFNYSVQLSTLVDLCIMHGCDFNERMVVPKKKFDSTNPYKSCGPKQSVELMKTYGNLDNFPAELYNFKQPLNIQVCREIFKYEVSGFTEKDTKMDYDIFKNNIHSVLSRYSVETYVRNNYFS